MIDYTVIFIYKNGHEKLLLMCLQVKHRSIPVFKRVKDIISNPDKQFYLFPNEFNKFVPYFPFYSNNCGFLYKSNITTLHSTLSHDTNIYIICTIGCLAFYFCNAYHDTSHSAYFLLLSFAIAFCFHALSWVIYSLFISNIILYHAKCF